MGCRALVGRVFFRHCLVVTPSAPLAFVIRTLHARLGSGLSCTAYPAALRCSPNSPGYSMEAFVQEASSRGPRADRGLPRPAARKGQYFNCQSCGDEFYRRASFVRRGITKTCGKRECISVSMSGSSNPFWGKEHSPEVREGLSTMRTARPSDAPPRRRYGPEVGGFKHTPEARAKIAEASRRMWAENRDKMLAAHPPKHKPREDQRYRKNFTPFQRKAWKADSCAWCATSENLVLDHIVPVRDGGYNLKENAQTLCQPCNMWKSVYVDRPMHLARLALQSG